MVLLVDLGHALLSTVPTPGGIGAVEPGVTGLLVLSVERNVAASITLVDRSITYLSVLAFGATAFALRQLSLRSPNARPVEPESAHHTGPARSD